jgi:integrase
MPEKLTKRFVEGLKPSEKPYERRDSEVKGFLVRVEPTGLKPFFYCYAFGNKRMNRYRLGAYPSLSVEGARAIAKVAAGDISKGIDPQARRKAERVKTERDKLLTLSTFLDERYEPWALAHMKSGKAQLERIRADFKDQLEKPMTVFHEVMVEGLRQKWKKAGNQPSTINRDLQRIGSVLTRAVKWGVLDKHPLAGLKPMKADKAGRVRFLSAAEETALREALVTREDRLRSERIRYNTWRIERHLDPLPQREGELLDHLKPMVLLALNTGLRRGELFSLKWSDVDLDAQMLTVRAASAKSGQTRRVPLNDEAQSVLTAWKERQESTTGYVFPGEGGSRLTNITKSWAGVVKLAKLNEFNFHDLRHTFASRLVQGGIDLNTVRTLLGHSEIATTLIYAHLAPDNLRSAVKKVAG